MLQSRRCMEEDMKDNITPSVKDRNFILQQGFDEPPSQTSPTFS
jgi:hypothetical protein